jgi:hypothetical protein
MKNLGYSLSFAVALLGITLPSVASAQSRTIEVEAGPIWSQTNAEQRCPEVARANGGVWDGRWHTTVPGTMSVCSVRVRASRHKYTVEEVEAGPIWNQADAQRKCSQIATANGGVWDGQWRTTVPGRMSVCELRLPRKDR